MGRHLFVGGQENGRHHTILYGNSAQFAGCTPAPTAFAADNAAQQQTLEFVEYTKRTLVIDGRKVQVYGLASMTDAAVADATVRLGRASLPATPVLQDGTQIGTLPHDFDPDNITSRSFLYDPRPGDFRREGDTWIADSALGTGDLEAIPGFVRMRARER